MPRTAPAAAAPKAAARSAPQLSMLQHIKKGKIPMTEEEATQSAVRQLGRGPGRRRYSRGAVAIAMTVAVTVAVLVAIAGTVQ